MLSVRFENKTYVWGDYSNDYPINLRQSEILEEIREKTYGPSALKLMNFVAEHPESIFVPTKDDIADLLSFNTKALVCTVPLMTIPFGPTAAATVHAAISVVWYGAVAVKNLSSIEGTERYSKWESEWNTIQKNRVMKEYILIDDQLKFFICKLSKTLPLIPVKIKIKGKFCKGVYDKETIEKWIKLHPGGEFPYTRCTLAEAELIVDFPHFISMIDRLKNLMERTFFALNAEANYYYRMSKEVASHCRISMIASMIMGFVSDSDARKKIKINVASHLERLSLDPSISDPVSVPKKLLTHMNEYQRCLKVEIERLKEEPEPTSSHALDGLKKRKIVWNERLNAPASPLPEYDGSNAYTHIRAGFDRLFHNIVLKEIDLAQNWDNRVKEYTRVVVVEDCAPHLVVEDSASHLVVEDSAPHFSYMTLARTLVRLEQQRINMLKSWFGCD